MNSNNAINLNAQGWRAEKLASEIKEKSERELAEAEAKVQDAREEKELLIKQAWPDPDTLAMLAAQGRFAKLPDADAARAALKLRQECLAALDETKERSRQRLQKALSIPHPKQGQATLDGFYKVIVRGKDNSENQPRFKRFLRFRAEGRKLDIDVWERDKRGGFVPRFKSDAGERTNKLSVRALDKEADRQFAAYQTKQFNETEWSDLAHEYRLWWAWQSARNKREAGLKRAAKAAAAKKRQTKSPPRPATGLDRAA